VIIEVPEGGELERTLSASTLAPVASGEAVVKGGPTDGQGNLESEPAGEVVLSFASPEGLRRESDEVSRVIRGAGTGVQPIVVELEVAEELREDELAPLLEAARHSRRPVILRIVRE